MKSSSRRSFWLLFNPWKCSDTRPENISRIRVISACSARSNSRSSLFIFTTDCGSMNKVDPLWDWSWTNPGNMFAYSRFTGMTYRPFRMVTIASCRNFCAEEVLTVLFSRFRMLSFLLRISFRIRFSSGEALSAISSSDKTQRSMSFSSSSTRSSRLPIS